MVQIEDGGGGGGVEDDQDREWCLNSSECSSTGLHERFDF